MDSDLLTAARALARRGWLPGVKIGFVGEDPEVFNDRVRGGLATEADLHLAAHREIVRRGAGYRIADNVTLYFPTLYRNVTEPGTATLSLLRALLAACEAAESKEKNT